MKNKGPYHLTAVTIVVVLTELVVGAVMVGIWLLILRNLSMFRFERPEMLRLLLIGPLLGVIFLVHLAWRNKALRRFTSKRTLRLTVPGISNTRMLLQFLFIRHGLGLVILSLAGPQLGMGLQEVRSEGVDIMVAIDVSNSMIAEDLKPNRLELARRALAQLIDRLKGDRLGIIVFAGEAFVQLPITTDRSAARLFLSSIGTDAIGRQGTAIGSAIELAHQSFGPDHTTSRAIIIITDGENHEDDAQGAARAAAENGIIVHTIGMGTPQGAPLPIRQGGRTIGFRKDAAGQTVVSRLDENMLTRIATAGNGSYIRATQGHTGIEELFDELRAMDHSETGTWQFAAHESRFQYPLGLGLFLITIGMSFGERRTKRALNQWTT